jgi:ubiquinone/menaquinone biosynthesis C-methylase UbiE
MDYYDTIAEGYNELHAKEQLDKIKTMLRHLQITDETILDVGCGTALYAYLFRNYKGIDPSKGMLEQSSADVVRGEAEDLPFEDKSFDIVISVSAIHNFKDYKKGIAEIKRVAKKRIIITLLKQAKEFEAIREELKDFKEIDHPVDLIFVKELKNGES